MMMSVMKKTRSPVKFWIVSNFVSSAYKQSIERLAKHLDFKYEFIQFKWPGWLRLQSKKHRTVWA
jgi:UDP-glucose:glycoprotein glucosyltransferase